MCNILHSSMTQRKKNKNTYIKLKQAGLKFSLSSTPQHVM